MMVQGRITKYHNLSRMLLASTVMLSLATTSFAKEKTTAKIPEAVPGEYVVKIKPQFGLMSLSNRGISKQLGVYVKSSIPSANIVIVKQPVFETSQAVISSLKQNPMIEYAEPNYIYRINRTSNDPMFGNLWGLKNVGQKDSDSRNGISGVDVQAQEAWDITTGSENVVVAVIDTGVDYNHPDLQGNIWMNEIEKNGQPGVDDDGNGYVDDIYGMNFSDENNPQPNGLDDHGHGTHCSGTIGARGDDGKGIVGVNWNVKIMPVKFLGADGGGTLGGAILAIDYATKMGARVLSNSWGGGGFSQALKESIERSQAAGTIFVAAAGNDSMNNDSSPTYPASYDVANILTVAAVDNRGQLAGFSNYGKKSVHVAAPGVNIFSSLVGGQYDSWSGTSMATPHVSGVAALVLANEPNLTGEEVKARIIATTNTLAALRGKTKTAGIVSAFKAVTNTTNPPDASDPENWQTVPASVSSVHPYSRKTSEVFEASVPGAAEISVYFEKFETESNYDKVTFYDRSGNVVGEMSGNNSGSFSPTISGDYVKMVLTSDDSVEGYGFDLTKIAYR